jgi:hypothetical protein
VVTTLVCSLHHLHARLRVHWAPGIPHALCFLGERFPVQLGRFASRECGAVFDECERHLSAVIVREGGRSSIPEALMIESRGRGILDRPVKPDDDRFGCLKFESASTVTSNNSSRPGLYRAPRAFNRVPERQTC